MRLQLTDFVGELGKLACARSASYRQDAPAESEPQVPCRVGDFRRWKDRDAYKESLEHVVRDLTRMVERDTVGLRLLPVRLPIKQSSPRRGLALKPPAQDRAGRPPMRQIEEEHSLRAGDRQRDASKSPTAWTAVFRSSDLPQSAARKPGVSAATIRGCPR
jgi:hypothetical protein